MSRQAYPKYKPSGVAWLEDIPEHWSEMKVSFIYNKSNAGEVIDKSYWGEGDELLFTCDRNPMRSDFPEFPHEKRTCDRDLLLTRNGTPYVHKPPAYAIYSNVVQRIRLKNDIERDFCSYALGAACLSLRGYGVSIESLNFGMWKSLRLVFPPLGEQRAIAAFLDRETARIDALIEKKQRQIALLKEKHIALISHAVTKGLNPNVKMKDSGIEWLGEIPAHWRLVPLRWYLRIGSGSFLSNMDFVTENTGGFTVPVIGGNGVMGYTNQLNIQYPTLAIGRVGVYCGNVHVIMPPAWVTDNALVLSQIRGFQLRFLAHTLVMANLNRLAKQNTQPLVTGTMVKEQTLPLPSESEQDHIISYIDAESRKIESLARQVRSSIDLLREYRTALISAAVTGKIDVRKEVA